MGLAGSLSGLIRRGVDLWREVVIMPKDVAKDKQKSPAKVRKRCSRCRQMAYLTKPSRSAGSQGQEAKQCRKKKAR